MDSNGTYIKPTILILENNVQASDIISFELSRSGYYLIRAYNGREGLLFMVNLKLCKRAPHEQIVNKRKSSRIGLNHLFTTDSIYYGFVSIMRVSAGGALVIDMNL